MSPADGMVVRVRPGGDPSTGEQVGVSVALLVIDLMVVAYLLFIRYGMTGWADGYDSGNPPEAPGEALRGMWLLAGGAVVSGGGLLVLGWRIPGVVQLVVLGTGAGLLACLAARG
ncbi:DUF6234 family protein [Streptomyces sp. AF1B]|uniref:DUF6234 family protein n=1 Tax=Streptomyces sp. AF1B TaxID=3399503 RepID=UPI003AAF0964